MQRIASNKVEVLYKRRGILCVFARKEARGGGKRQYTAIRRFGDYSSIVSSCRGYREYNIFLYCQR